MSTAGARFCRRSIKDPCKSVKKDSTPLVGGASAIGLVVSITVLSVSASPHATTTSSAALPFTASTTEEACCAASTTPDTEALGPADLSQS